MNDVFRVLATDAEGGGDPVARDAVAPMLDAGEQLVWAGRPLQGVRLTAGDALLIPFSIVWAGFAFFWEAMVIAKGAPFFFRLWGIPFVLMGLYILIGRFFYDAYLRARTFYALSDRRALIVSTGRTRQLVSVSLAQPTISLVEHAKGHGAVVFGIDSSARARPSFTWSVNRPGMAPRFDLVPNAREVYARARRIHGDLMASSAALVEGAQAPSLTTRPFDFGSGS